MTIPAPPPYGVSSTLRWRSVVCSRGSCTRTSSRPCARARPSSDASSGPAKYSGKIVNDVDAHATCRRSGRVRARTGRRADRRRRRRSRCSTTNTIGTSAPPSSTSRSCAGFASTATHRAERRAGAVDAPRRRPARAPRARPRGARGVARRSGSPVSVTPRRRFGGGAVVDALEAHEHPALVRSRTRRSPARGHPA